MGLLVVVLGVAKLLRRLHARRPGAWCAAFRAGTRADFLMSTAERALYEIGFIPVLWRCMNMLVCEVPVVAKHAAGAIATGASPVLSKDPTLKCFEGPHAALVATALVSIAVLYALAMRHMFDEGHNVDDPFRYLREFNVVKTFVLAGVVGVVTLLGETAPALAMALLAAGYALMAWQTYATMPALGRGLLVNNMNCAAFAVGVWAAAIGVVSFYTGRQPWALALFFVGSVPVYIAAFFVNNQRARRFALPKAPLEQLLVAKHAYVRHAAAATYVYIACVPRPKYRDAKCPGFVLLTIGAIRVFCISRYAVLDSRYIQRKGAGDFVEQAFRHLSTAAVRPEKDAAVTIQCCISLLRFAQRQLEDSGKQMRKRISEMRVQRF